MAAITKRLLHLRPTFHSYARPYPYPQHHFSSSSDDRDDDPQSEQPPQTRSSITSSLNAVRASLENQPSPPPDRSQPPRRPFSFPQTPPPSQDGSTDEIRHQLSEFRSRSAPPPPPSGGQIVSFEELYERNVKSKGKSSAAPSGLGRQSSNSIRESLSKLRPAGAVNSGMQPSDSLPLSSLRETWKNKANPPFLQYEGGTRMRKNDRSDLGEKLKMMRPEKRKGKWFSVQELSDRLAKLKEAGLKESQKFPAPTYHAIAEGLNKIGQDAEQKAKAKSQKTMTIGVLGAMGAVMTEKTGPPKDHLVEKYFHPDNMSSAEQMKLELAKVRDEFKMSESDCGSARVQVAQLTTKIKHLSTALHKKDKHSRRGLQAMVQRRKKLLKYLRRTDWDSYCLVLSKLGLRDNVDIKA